MEKITLRIVLITTYMRAGRHSNGKQGILILKNTRLRTGRHSYGTQGILTVNNERLTQGLCLADTLEHRAFLH